MSSNRIIEILEDYLAWAQLDERVGGYKNLPQSERKKLRLHMIMMPGTTMSS